MLAVIWFAAAIGGAIAAIVGLSTHRALRRVALSAAGVLFGIAGVLGILSIGIVFMAISAVCFVTAARATDAAAATRRMT